MYATDYFDIPLDIQVNFCDSSQVTMSITQSELIVLILLLTCPVLLAHIIRPTNYLYKRRAAITSLFTLSGHRQVLFWNLINLEDNKPKEVSTTCSR